MEALEAIPSISRLSKNVIRILGQNPGKFTLQGTNTYLVGQRNPYVLIDTGEGREEYLPFLEKALKEEADPVQPDEADISDIILTHKHHDHCGGLSSVLTLLTRLWTDRHSGNPAAFPPLRIHKIPLPSPDAKLQSIIDSLPSYALVPSPSGSPIHDLRDSQTLSITTTSAASSSHLQVQHTPGHTEDSLCLYLPEDRAFFTADTVLGQGTAVFEDLGAYMASLRKMLEFAVTGGSTEPKYTVLYPGHGPVVSDGPKYVEMYLRHREEREAQIVKVLSSPQPSEGSWTTWTIVAAIYANYPRQLWEPAAHSVDLHLQKLARDGRVQYLGGSGKDTQWKLLG